MLSRGGMSFQTFLPIKGHITKRKFPLYELANISNIKLLSYEILQGIFI